MWEDLTARPTRGSKQFGPNFRYGAVRYASKIILVAILSICAYVVSGCLESSFELAQDSRLPIGVVLPSGFTRADILVTLDFYTMGQAKFTVRENGGKKLTTVTGKTIGDPIYLTPTRGSRSLADPGYEIVAIEGVTEILKCISYREGANMVRNGHPIAIFSVVDDPTVKSQVLEAAKMNR